MKWLIPCGVLSVLIVVFIVAGMVRDESAQTAVSPPTTVVSGLALPISSPSAKAAFREFVPSSNMSIDELGALLEGGSESMTRVDLIYEESEFASDGVSALARYELPSGGEVAIALRQFADIDQLAENRKFAWVHGDAPFETDASYGRAVSVAGALAFETFNHRSKKAGLRAVLGEGLAVEIDASGVEPSVVRNMMEDIAFRYSTSIQIAGFRHGN